MPDGVSIETGEVRAFANRVRGDAASNDTAAQGARLRDTGVFFGHRVAGDIVRQAKFRYAEALQHTEANLRMQLAMARVLADVAERVAQEFEQADTSSAEQQTRVRTLLANGLHEALKRQQEANLQQDLKLTNQTVTGGQIG